MDSPHAADPQDDASRAARLVLAAVPELAPDPRIFLMLRVAWSIGVQEGIVRSAEALDAAIAG